MFVVLWRYLVGPQNNVGQQGISFRLMRIVFGLLDDDSYWRDADVRLPSANDGFPIRKRPIPLDVCNGCKSPRAEVGLQLTDGGLLS